eukprot:TRINITY_DN109350_c0_g1_i1.p1 TRINITY_DN109350_c0_g1~~TRINITY_DN109350_c0_g1_i1.p1  ORF type:complete len:301 (-),score=64.69 TRINITY_DN109350_c0_g1_i1:23-925(-)
MAFRMMCLALTLLSMPHGIVEGQSIEEMIGTIENHFKAGGKVYSPAPGGADSTGLDHMREDDPRRPKRISVKTARAFMKEVLPVLSTEPALAVLAGARALMAVDFSHKDYWPSLTSKAGPSLNRLTREVLQKHNFASDFEQAVMSVEEARERKRDKELTESLERMKDIFTGKFSSAQGVLKELEDLAEKFLDQKKSEQKRTIALAESIAEGVTDSQAVPIAKLYIDVMRAVHSHGNLVRKTIENMMKEAQKDHHNGKKPELEEIGRYDMRMGVLTKFLPEDERRRLFDPDAEPPTVKAEL